MTTATRTIRIVIDSSGATPQINRITQNTERATFSVNKLAAAIASVLAADKLKDFADSFTSIQNQIRRTTENQDQLNDSTKALLGIANDTRSSLSDTTELYTSLAISTKSLGYSQDQVLGITKTLNNLFLESGKSAEESSGAIRQLGQALQSGALRGDEFNSVAEGAPGILRAIQAQTGKTAGELRDFAATGGITAELLTKSLENYSDKAQEAADKTKITFSQSLIVAKNNATFFVGSINDAVNVTGGLAKNIISLSESLSSTENIENFIRFFKQFSLTIEASSGDLSGYTEEIDLLGSIGTETLNTIGGAFRDFAPNVKAAVQIVVVEVTSMIDKVSAKFTRFSKYLKSFMSGDGADESLKNYEIRINAITSARESSIEQIMKERDAVISAAKESSKATSGGTASGNSNFGNAADVGAAHKQTEKELKQHLKNLADIEKEWKDSVNAEGAMWDQVQEAKDVSKSMELELSSRQKVAQFYRDAEAAGIEGSYAREAALINAMAEEKRAAASQRTSEDLQKIKDQEAEALVQVGANEQARDLIIKEYATQREIAAEIHAANLAAINKKAADDQKRLDEAAAKAKYDTFIGMGQDLMNAAQGQSKKLFHASREAAVASAIIDSGKSALAAWRKGMESGGPWTAAGFAAASLLKTVPMVQKLKNSSYSGGGGSMSMGSGSAAISQMPTTATSNEPAFEQKKVIELRGITPETLLSGQQFIDALTSTGAVVAMNNAQAQAQRIGVI